MVCFLMAFCQVFLVSINVFFISELNWIGIAATSLILNAFWMWNVNKMSKVKSVYYPIGAMCGCLGGSFVGTLLN